MLQDKDRIFTNIYGLKDKSLKGAMARGHWDNTKGLIEKGRDWIIDEMKASGLRGARRCRLPDGPEMVLHAQGSRMGVRTTSWSMPTNPSRGPARTGRSCGNDPHLADRGLHAGLVLAMAAHACLHLHPWRVSLREKRRACRRRSTSAYAARHRRQGQQVHGYPISTSTSITVPAPTFAARKPPCWKAWKARRGNRG